MHALFSTGMAIHRAPRVVLPLNVVLLMQNILPSLPNSSLEYGIYLKGTWNAETASVLVSDEYYIPEQEVTAATIRFIEEPPGSEWNVVIHRHPPGCRKFSGVDKSSINEEFLASILFLPPWEFPDAVVNVPLSEGSKLQVEATVVLQGPAMDASLAGAVRTKIHEHRVAAPLPPPMGQSGPAVQMGRGLVRPLAPRERYERPMDMWNGDFAD